MSFLSVFLTFILKYLPVSLHSAVRMLFSSCLCLQDVYDKLDYLSSLGKTQIAAVRRDADIGVAEAERDAGIRVICLFYVYWCARKKTADHRSVFFVFQEAECKKEMMDVKFLADTKMADSKRELELEKASFNQEINTKVGHSAVSFIF